MVGVIDDGVDCTHPEFEGRIVHPFDARSGLADANPHGWEPHGTKVSGVVAAAGLELVGVAPGATLLPVRLPSVREESPSPEEATAILHAAKQGADVICCAWGVDALRLGRFELPSVTFDAIDWAVTHGRNGRGCVMVFAAGNEGAEIQQGTYTADPGVIAVGACNSEDRHAAYSNTGAALHCVFPSSDLAVADSARRSIATTTPTGSFQLGDAWYTDSFGRTSAACAGVAGICALILSANPALSAGDVSEILRSSCVKIDSEAGSYAETGHSPLYGFGRPDAGSAVQLALERAAS